MPVHIKHDKDGCFAIWGEKGKKYYFQCGNNFEMEKAKKKAFIQGITIILRKSDGL